jgi:hypothetical protein
MSWHTSATVIRNGLGDFQQLATAAAIVVSPRKGRAVILTWR